jgi:hypothetical protein
MDINTLYSIKIKDCNSIFKDSVAVYRDAVDFLIPVCIDHWDEISGQADLQHKKMYVEHLVHKTDKYPHPLYDFDGKFYKFPSYLLKCI